MLDFPRFPISELHLGQFPDSMEFQCWKDNFKTALCANSTFPHIAMLWIKEIEIAKSMDDILTSPSITGRRDFFDYETLDAKIASAPKKAFWCSLPKESQCRRVTCSERQPILTRRQIAYMICEHLRACGACEAVPSLSRMDNGVPRAGYATKDPTP